MTGSAIASPRGWLSRLRPARDFPYVSAAILAAVLIAAVLGEDLAPYDPNGLDLGAAFKPPIFQAIRRGGGSDIRCRRRIYPSRLGAD